MSAYPEVLDPQTANEISVLASFAAGFRGLPPFIQAAANDISSIAEETLKNQAALVEALSAGVARQAQASESVKLAGDIDKSKRTNSVGASSSVRAAAAQEPKLQGKVKEVGVEGVSPNTQGISPLKKPDPSVTR